MDGYNCDARHLKRTSQIEVEAEARWVYPRECCLYSTDGNFANRILETCAFDSVVVAQTLELVGPVSDPKCGESAAEQQGI